MSQSTTTRTRKPRARKGEPWRLISELIRKHGHVTSAMYAERARMRSRRHAYNGLRDQVLRGRLEPDVLDDGTVGFFPLVRLAGGR